MEDMKKRKQYDPEFKAQVVIEVLREEATINEIAAKYEVNPVMLSRWKTEFVSRASDVFRKGPTETDKELEDERQHVAELERKVGQLAYEVDWLKKKRCSNSGLTKQKKAVILWNIKTKS